MNPHLKNATEAAAVLVTLAAMVAGLGEAPPDYLEGFGKWLDAHDPEAAVHPTWQGAFAEYCRDCKAAAEAEAKAPSAARPKKPRKEKPPVPPATAGALGRHLAALREPRHEKLVSIAFPAYVAGLCAAHGDAAPADGDTRVFTNNGYAPLTVARRVLPEWEGLSEIVVGHHPFGDDPGPALHFLVLDDSRWALWQFRHHSPDGLVEIDALDPATRRENMTRLNSWADAWLELLRVQSWEKVAATIAPGGGVDVNRPAPVPVAAPDRAAVEKEVDAEIRARLFAGRDGKLASPAEREAMIAARLAPVVPAAAVGENPALARLRRLGVPV